MNTSVFFVITDPRYRSVTTMSDEIKAGILDGSITIRVVNATELHAASDESLQTFWELEGDRFHRVCDLDDDDPD